MEPASAPVAGALFCTPAQGSSSLLHDVARTAGLPTVAMHGHDAEYGFDTIQEHSFSTDSPGGVAACHSTPTLHGAGGCGSGASHSSGTPVAGGCHTAVGKREGTPAFGAVDGLDEPGTDSSLTPVSCTGTDCGITPELPAMDYTNGGHHPVPLRLSRWAVTLPCHNLQML